MSGYVPRNLRGGKSTSGSGKKAEPSRDREERTTKPKPKPASTRPSGSAAKKSRPSPRPTGGGKRGTNKRSLRGWRPRMPRVRVPGGRTLAKRLAPATLAVIMLAVGMWFAAGQTTQLPWQSDPSSDARKAAVNAASAMFSYDYRTFDESLKNGSSYVTGDFSKEYTKHLEGLRTNAEKEKAQVKADIKNSAVISQNGECSTKSGQVHTGVVEVLVFMNQLTKNANVEGSKQDSSRLVMCMAPADGSWKAANVKVL